MEVEGKKKPSQGPPNSSEHRERGDRGSSSPLEAPAEEE